MEKFQDEITLSVNEYKDSESCAEDTEAALLEFQEMAESKDIKVESIESIEFLEFDSGNASHASAYFVIDYVANKSIWFDQEE